MASSNQNNILCAVDTTAQILGDLETVVDILDYPFSKIAMSDGLLKGCRKWKIQQGALLPRT
jgi:hypothetical protein